MKKSQISTIKIWKIVIFYCFVCNLFIWNLVFAESLSAQTLGLSISPPINEIMIIPGKNVTQNYTVSNNGIDGYASIFIVPFKAEGEDGKISLNEEDTITANSPYASWFSIASPNIKLGEKFYIRQGEATVISLKISPPSDAPEKDYYFTIIYQLESDYSSGFRATGSTNQARVGSNLLISLSENGVPEKNFEISEFSAPKFIDSLGKLKFNVRIKNNGLYLFKSNGNISIKSTFNQGENLEIAPFNIISGSTRNIPCIKEENIFACESSKKVFLGIYKSTLKVSPDGGENSQEKTAKTVALPFSLTAVGILIYLSYKILNKSKRIL